MEDDNIIYLKDFREKANIKKLEKTIEEYFLSLDLDRVVMKPKTVLQNRIEVLIEMQERLTEELEELKHLQEAMLKAQGQMNKRSIWKMIKKTTTTLKVIRFNIESKKKEIAKGGER